MWISAHLEIEKNPIHSVVSQDVTKVVVEIFLKNRSIVVNTSRLLHLHTADQSNLISICFNVFESH